MTDTAKPKKTKAKKPKSKSAPPPAVTPPAAPTPAATNGYSFTLDMAKAGQISPETLAKITEAAKQPLKRVKFSMSGRDPSDDSKIYWPCELEIFEHAQAQAQAQLKNCRSLQDAVALRDKLIASGVARPLTPIDRSLQPFTLPLDKTSAEAKKYLQECTAYILQQPKLAGSVDLLAETIYLPQEFIAYAQMLRPHGAADFASAMEIRKELWQLGAKPFAPPKDAPKDAPGTPFTLPLDPNWPDFKAPIEQAVAAAMNGQTGHFETLPPALQFTVPAGMADYIAQLPKASNLAEALAQRHHILALGGQYQEGHAPKSITMTVPNAPRLKKTKATPQPTQPINDGRLPLRIDYQNAALGQRLLANLRARPQDYVNLALRLQTLKDFAEAKQLLRDGLNLSPAKIVRAKYRTTIENGKTAPWQSEFIRSEPGVVVAPNQFGIGVWQQEQMADGSISSSEPLVPLSLNFTTEGREALGKKQAEFLQAELLAPQSAVAAILQRWAKVTHISLAQMALREILLNSGAMLHAEQGAALHITRATGDILRLTEDSLPLYALAESETLYVRHGKPERDGNQPHREVLKRDGKKVFEWLNESGQVQRQNAAARITRQPHGMVQYEYFEQPQTKPNRDPATGPAVFALSRKGRMVKGSAEFWQNGQQLQDTEIPKSTALVPVKIGFWQRGKWRRAPQNYTLP